MLMLTSPLLEGDDNGNSSDAVGTSRKRTALELRNRTVSKDATGSRPLTCCQSASCIPDVDRACVTINETISHGRHCMLRGSNCCKHQKAQHAWQTVMPLVCPGPPKKYAKRHRHVLVDMLG